MTSINFKPTSFSAQLGKIEDALNDTTNKQKLNDGLMLVKKENGFVRFLKIIALPFARMFGADPFKHSRINNVALALIGEFHKHKADLNPADAQKVRNILIKLNQKSKSKYAAILLPLAGLAEIVPPQPATGSSSSSRSSAPTGSSSTTSGNSAPTGSSSSSGSSASSTSSTSTTSTSSAPSGAPAAPVFTGPAPEQINLGPSAGINLADLQAGLGNLKKADTTISRKKPVGGVDMGNLAAAAAAGRGTLRSRKRTPAPRTNTAPTETPAQKVQREMAERRAARAKKASAEATKASEEDS